MGNVLFSAEYSNDRLGFIFIQVNKAITEVFELGFRPEEILISMPTYFKEILIVYNTGYLFNYMPNDQHLFGCKIVPAYENKIVIFHEDMPKLDIHLYHEILLK